MFKKIYVCILLMIFLPGIVLAQSSWKDRKSVWEPLLQDVYRIRHKGGMKPSLSRWRRAEMTKQYLLFGIEECKKRWGE